MSAQKTKTDFISGGNSDYIIVLPDNPLRYEKFAASEIREFIYRASGITLKVAAESKIAQKSKCGKILAVGNTQAAINAGVECKNSVSPSAFKLKTDGTTVILRGRGDIGTLYAAYKFLNILLDFEVFSADEIYIKTNVAQLELPDIDIAESPDIPFRNAYGRKYYFYAENAHRMRLSIFEEIFIRDSYQPWHNCFRYLPFEEYRPQHPKWYTEEEIFDGFNTWPAQFHYTARGDKQEAQALEDAIFQKMKEKIEQDFAEEHYAEIISFTALDNGKWAADASTDEYKQKYGEAYPAAMQIHFLNKLAKRIKKYMAEYHDGRPMNILSFAYRATEDAPVREENGQYIPIDDSVVLEDNIHILYAPIKANFTEDFNHSSNHKYKVILDKWKAITKTISFWIYSPYFRNTLMMYDTFTCMQSQYRLLKSYNAYYVFNESNWNYHHTAFNSFKEYLGANLLWNCNDDVKALTERFFKNYFKQASDSMLALYNNTLKHLREQLQSKGYPTDVLTPGGMADAVYWPLSVVNGLLSHIEKAFLDIEPLKLSDPALHSILEKRVLTESISMRYVKLRNYPEEFESKDLFYIRRQLLADIEKVGIKAFSNEKTEDGHKFLIKDWVTEPKKMPIHY